MEEIKIKMSIVRWIVVILAAVALVAVLYCIRTYLTGPDYKVLESIIHFVGSMGVFCLIFFYLGRPTRLVINDTSLTVNTQEEWRVRFDGVDSFYVDKFNGHTFIGVRYKDNTEEAITDEEIAKGRKQRSKAALKGYPYEIYVSGLSKTPQEIWNLLNSRLNQIH